MVVINKDLKDRSYGSRTAPSDGALKAGLVKKSHLTVRDRPNLQMALRNYLDRPIESG